MTCPLETDPGVMLGLLYKYRKEVKLVGHEVVRPKRGKSLVKDARRQSPDVVAVLVDNHRKFLSFLKGRIANPSDAEEILQAAFVKSIKKSDSIRNDESVVAWFYRLLRNAVVDYYRHRDAERRAMDHLASMVTETETHQPDIERAICRCVYDLLPTLKDDYSKLLMRVDLEGASITEVATETGMTANNTRVKLHRARKALLKQLQLSCGSCAEHGCLDCDCRPSS
jgi:RNA polymerase sigma factor (sigma-70 family)